MSTPLYTTDVQKITDRTPKTSLVDADVFVVANSSGVLAPLTKVNAKDTLGIDANATAITTLNGDVSTSGSVLKVVKDNAQNATYDPATSGLSATTVKTAVDELASEKEDKSNKKTTLADNSDTFYPSQKAVKTVTDDHESRIVVLENWTRVKSWLDVQEVVRAGRAPAYFPAGLQLGADWNYTSRVFDVIGINHDTPTDTGYTHSLTIQANDILRSGRISAPEAMYNAVTELPAGTYIFTTNGVQYTFTSAQAVPAGGVIFIKTRNEYAPLTLTIYGANRTSIIEDNIAVTTTTGTDNLTPINDHFRMRYGNNNYEISALRQWLNSEDATFAWQPLGLYDMPSTYETAGFVNLLDADLQAVIGAVDKQVALATYDGGGQELFSDKVFLLSRKEIFGDDEGVVTGEVVYPFWDGSSNADRIKGSPSSWWLRSPDVSLTGSTRVVYTSGVLVRDYASYSHGLAPACVII